MAQSSGRADKLAAADNATRGPPPYLCQAPGVHSAAGSYGIDIHVEETGGKGCCCLPCTHTASPVLPIDWELGMSMYCSSLCCYSQPSNHSAAYWGDEPRHRRRLHACLLSSLTALISFLRATLAPGLCYTKYRKACKWIACIGCHGEYSGVYVKLPRALQ